MTDEINSVNDFFDFKLSVKSILMIVVGWSLLMIVIVIVMLGGINNTIDYLTNIVNSTKKTIIQRKNKSKGIEEEEEDKPKEKEPAEKEE